MYAEQLIGKDAVRVCHTEKYCGKDGHKRGCEDYSYSINGLYQKGCICPLHIISANCHEIKYTHTGFDAGCIHGSTKVYTLPEEFCDNKWIESKDQCRYLNNDCTYHCKACNFCCDRSDCCKPENCCDCRYRNATYEHYNQDGTRRINCESYYINKECNSRRRCEPCEPCKRTKNGDECINIRCVVCSSLLSNCKCTFGPHYPYQCIDCANFINHKSCNRCGYTSKNAQRTRTGSSCKDVRCLICSRYISECRCNRGPYYQPTQCLGCTGDHEGLKCCTHGYKQKCDCKEVHMHFPDAGPCTGHVTEDDCTKSKVDIGREVHEEILGKYDTGKVKVTIGCKTLWVPLEAAKAAYTLLKGFVGK